MCSSRRFHRPAPYHTTSFQDWDNPEVRVPLTNPAFNFSDISQNNGTSGQQHYDNILWYRAKVYEHGVRPINHVKCYHFNWPIGADFNRDRAAPSDAEAGAKFWRAVFAGAASIRFHRHTPLRTGGLREGFGLAPEGQRHLQSMREFVASVRLFTMEPRNDLLLDRTDDEAYCLAEPGRQYAVFFTGNGDRSVRIHLSNTDHSLELRWLNVATSRWEHEGTLPRPREYKLTAPHSGHWVAMMEVAAR